MKQKVVWGKIERLREKEEDKKWLWRLQDTARDKSSVAADDAQTRSLLWM